MGDREVEAGTTNGASLPERLAGAIARHRSGRLEEAEKVYAEVLAAEPDNVDALHYLGVLRHQQGRSYVALQLVSRAIKLKPDAVDAINNLGNIYLQVGTSVEAIVAYQHVLELRPDHPDASRNLGIARRRLERDQETVERCERAIEHDPGEVANYYALANAYRRVARYEEVLATLKKALAVRPEADAFRWLGHLLRGLGRHAEAAANYEAWLRAEPDHPIPKHMLAAGTLKDVPARAGDAFVASVFDTFAETFDEVLMGRLEYRAPALVGEALKRIDGEARGELHVVDAGCGTGLLAQYLRPYARRLVGVDLSPKMQEKARTRGYDELVVAEIGSFLRSSPGRFDLVASSDTLVYFGDLREVLAAARTALRPGGRLVFTVEHAAGEDEVPAGYRIHPHGRYSHTEAYVRRTLAEAGFEVVELEKAHLRREGGGYVEGLLVAARAMRR
jgi:predicted TPR repeat methyltransferase